MDKRRAIQIMTKAAQLYREHLDDQKVMFLYGVPSEINKQLSTLQPRPAREFASKLFSITQ